MSQKCTILAPKPENIQHCVELLSSDEVVAVPTETVYGLAGNALNEASVRKIFAVKGRPLIDPLIVHFPSVEAAIEHVEFNKAAQKLADTYWPGALTLVLPKKSTIPDLVTAGLPSVAIRIPSHPVFHELLSQLPFPLAAPSANPFGYVSPTLAEHVSQTLGSKIPAVLDGGACDHGVESTIVDLRDPKAPKILRPGPISSYYLEAVLEISLQVGHTPLEDTQAQAAPGMLSQHYSPHTAIRLFDYGTVIERSSNEAVLYNAKPTAEIDQNTYWLSESGEMVEVAHNLFKLIQVLDAKGYDRLLIERAADEGIGMAVNDRLSRAAAKR